MSKLQQKSLKNWSLIQIAHLNQIYRVHERTQKSQNNSHLKCKFSCFKIWNKIGQFIGQGIFDILIINETKLDAFFPVNRIFINGC